MLLVTVFCSSALIVHSLREVVEYLVWGRLAGDSMSSGSGETIIHAGWELFSKETLGSPMLFVSNKLIDSPG